MALSTLPSYGVTGLALLACGVLWFLTRRRVSVVRIMDGHVTHRRSRPSKHSFGYGLFYAMVDCDELEGSDANHWWPVFGSWSFCLARFCRQHHLHDRRCRQIIGGRKMTLKEEVLAVLEHDTGVRFDGKVYLLTHLRYLGYFFSPVSFYYVYGAAGGGLQAIVAEVSNTPWDEMHCYSLHPANARVQHSVDEHGMHRYVFAKEFHVSPFMEMDSTYDWKFTDPFAGGGAPRLFVSTSMYRGEDQWFTATLKLAERDTTALSMLYQVLLRNPLMTHVIQTLIHYEAFRLWLKKVPIFEHPEGTVTALSSVISTMMAPLYRLEAWMDARKEA